jgi:SAM-dependent methyltransferase
MKKKPSSLEETPLSEETAILIAAWRKLLKLPIGPLDRLQTREFRSLTAAIERLHQENQFSDKELLGAYLLYDWQLHLAQASSLLKEIPTFSGRCPARVLDLACGAAPFGLAALKAGAREVVGLDFNSEALKIAGEVCGKLGYPLSLRQHDCRNFNLPVEGKWDLIIIGYALYELTDDPLFYIKHLMSRLSEEGYLLIVEPSHAEANQRLLMLRDSLNQNNIQIQAPCLWRGLCPALKHGKSACYAQRLFDKPPLVKEIQRSLRINLNSLKMSYLLLKNSPLSQLTRPLYRVVSPPVETFRGTRFFLCGNEGQKTLGSALKVHPKHARAFEYIQRGDIISVQNAVERQDDFEVQEETKIKLEAPCDKPVPSV